MPGARCDQSAARGYAEPLREIACHLREDEVFTAAPATVDLASLEAIYTMNEEHDIHRAVVDSLGLDAASPEPAAADPEPGEAELDDFLL